MTPAIHRILRSPLPLLYPDSVPLPEAEQDPPQDETKEHAIVEEQEHSTEPDITPEAVSDQ